MKISKKRLQQIVAEEIKLSLTENKKSQIDILFENISRALELASAREPNIINSPKYKAIKRLVGEKE